MDHPVQGALARERAREQRVLTTSAHRQRRERLHDRRADRPADAYLVAPRLAGPGRSVRGWHAIMVGVRGMSAHRIVRVNRTVWLKPRWGATMCVVADAGAVVDSAAFGLRAWLVPRPGLFELLGTAERVVLVSAPAGSREDVHFALLDRRGGPGGQYGVGVGGARRARRAGVLAVGSRFVAGDADRVRAGLAARSRR
jgi:hypothetical protein